MKYILTIIFSLALVSPVFAASESGWQDVATGTGSNAGVLETGLPDGILMAKPTASPAPSTGPFTSTQTVTLSAPSSNSIHYFLNTTDLNNALTCSTGATANPVTIEGPALLRAIACYNSPTGLIAGPMASFSYEFEAPPATTPATSSGGTTGGGGGSYTPPVAPPTLAQADFNSDGSVDILDFNTLITNWGATGATKSMGDANSDGTVDIFDFNILITNWS